MLLNYTIPGTQIYFPVHFTGFNPNKGNLNRMPQDVSDPSYNHKELYIILADDDSDDRELFSEAIEETNFQVKLDTAEDGETFLCVLKSSKNLPDIIFLDLNMPNKNGKECLAELRSSVKYNQVPVIIYSTSSSKRDIDEVYEKGANLYISKPSSFQELKRIANEVLTLDWEKYKPKSCRRTFVFTKKSK